MKKPIVRDHNYTIYRPTGEFVTADGREYKQGIIDTRHGIVSVYQQWGDGDDDHCRFNFAWNGRLHYRTIFAVYSERHLITLAARFAREIAEGSASA